jgi:hypothetical protein
MGGWLPCEYSEYQHWGETKKDQQTETLHLGAVIWGGPSHHRAHHDWPGKYGLEVRIMLRGVPAVEREQVVHAHKDALRALMCAMLSQRSMNDA